MMPPRPSRPLSLRRHRLIIAIMAPVLALMAFSAWVVSEKMDDYRHSAELLTATRIARLAQSLTRDLESERMLSARTLEAGDLQGRYELEAQRLRTDRRLDDLQTALRRPEVTRRLAGTTIIDIGRLHGLRQVIDNDAIVDAALADYAQSIAQLAALSSSLAPTDLSRLISAYMDLGSLKDRVARARVLFFSGDPPHVDARTLLENDAEARAFEESFRSDASAAQAAMLDAVLATPAAAAAARLHQRAGAGLLSAEDRAAWDETHAALLRLFSETEERLAADMEQGIERHLSSTRLAFFLVVLGVVVVVGLSLETLRRSERRAVLWKEEARKLFRAVEQSPISVLISDARGIIEYVNPAFSTLTGYARPEIVGQSPRLLRSEQTPPELFTAMWAAISAGHDWRGELVNLRKDGSTYWESMTVSPVKGEGGAVENFIAFKEDITEVRSLRQALEMEHANLRRIFASTKDLIALIDGRGHFLYANPALEEAFGPALGTAADYFQPAIANLSDDAAPTRGEWVSDLNGKTYEVAITPVDTTRGDPSALLALHDITVRKQVELAMAEAREAAELSNRVKSEFLATMSHELRTPLNAIIGFSEIIENQLLGPLNNRQYQDYAHDIHQSGRHLLALINDILDVARLEVGRFTLCESELTVADLIAAATTMVGERAHAGGVTIEQKIPADLPGLCGDGQRIKQALVNILGNAVKFTPAGGTVTVTVECGEGGLDMVIADTGIGIHADDMNKILAPFGQVESSLARRFEGAGLGLPLTRQFMDLHGGAMTIVSTPGQGTAVTLHFPAHRLRCS